MISSANFLMVAVVLQECHAALSLGPLLPPTQSEKKLTKPGNRTTLDLASLRKQLILCPFAVLFPSGIQMELHLLFPGIRLPPDLGSSVQDLVICH